MTRHFGAQHIANGYAAMGKHPRRPIHKGTNTGRSVAESIAAERHKAVREANARKSNK